MDRAHSYSTEMVSNTNAGMFNHLLQQHDDLQQVFMEENFRSMKNPNKKNVIFEARKKLFQMDYEDQHYMRTLGKDSTSYKDFYKKTLFVIKKQIDSISDIAQGSASPLGELENFSQELLLEVGTHLENDDLVRMSQVSRMGRAIFGGLFMARVDHKEIMTEDAREMMKDDGLWEIAKRAASDKIQ